MCSDMIVCKGAKIKIFFLLPSFTFGGAERTSLNLLSGLNRDLFSIYLSTSRSVYKYFEHLNLDEFMPIEDLKIKTWFSNYENFKEEAKKVADLLKTEKPDISFGMMHYPSSLLVFAKKFYNLETKVIVSPRGPSEEYLKYFVKTVRMKLFFREVFTFFLMYADGIIVASKGMKDECIKNFSANPNIIEVIPNSINTEEILKKTSEDIDIDLPSGTFLLSALSRLEKEKNLTLLLAAFSDVIKKEKATLLLIGEGSERDSLESLCHKLGINMNVIFAGYQLNPYKYLKKSDIFVHTCLFEGFANVIIEAMTCGVPVIATDCPYGPRDIITNGVNGFLVNMNDRKALANTIIKLMHDKNLRHSIAQKGLIRSKDFSLKAMVDRYEDFFTRIIKK